MTIQELTRGEQWVWAQLAGMTAVAYSGIAPVGAAMPYIVIKVQSPGADVLGVGTARIMAKPLYLVEAVGKVQSWATLATLADAIDTRLHGQTGTTNDGRILACVREMPFSLIEDVNGVQYRHLGGLYRCIVQGL